MQPQLFPMRGTISDLVSRSLRGGTIADCLGFPSATPSGGVLPWYYFSIFGTLKRYTLNHRLVSLLTSKHLWGFWSFWLEPGFCYFAPKQTPKKEYQKLHLGNPPAKMGSSAAPIGGPPPGFHATQILSKRSLAEPLCRGDGLLGPLPMLIARARAMSLSRSGGHGW